MPDTVRQFKASVFQALAHPTRLAILEALREGELTAGTLMERLGVEQANVSQHLMVLRTRQIVASRKEGSHVYYSVRDPVLFEMLDLMRRYVQAHLHEAVSLLQELDREESGAR